MSSINTNLQGLKLSNVLFDLTTDLNKRLKNLSSGAKVNNASDDSAAMFVNTKLNSQINGIDSTNHNIQIASNALSLAEGALNSIRNSLQKIRDLNLQALNSTYSVSSKNSIQNQINSLYSEIFKIQDSTMFNNKPLFVHQEKIDDPTQTQVLNPSVPQVNIINSINIDSSSTFSTTLIDDSFSTAIDSNGNNVSLLSLDDDTNYIQCNNNSVISLANGETKYIKINFNGTTYRYSIYSNAATETKIQFDGNYINFVSTNNTSTLNNITTRITAIDDGFGHNIKTNLKYTTIIGTSKDDNIRNTGVAATIYGGNGNDTIETTGIKGLVYGGDGNDTITISGANSSAFGEEGNDRIIINNTNVCAFGGNGDDHIINNKDTAESVIDGGNGKNTLSNTSNINGLITNIYDLTTDSVCEQLLIGETKVISINGVNYTIQNTSGTLSSFVYKINGDNSIDFGGSQLTIRGQNNVAHNANVYGTSIVFHGGDQNDNITNYASYTTINGGNGNDTIINNNYRQITINGNNGDDTIIMNALTNSINTGSGNNTVYFNYNENSTDPNKLGTMKRNFYGSNTIYLNGNNLFLQTQALVTTNFHDSNNTIYINGNGNKITTGSGDDNFIINGNNNVIKCGDGNDHCTIVSGDLNNADGGNGTDYIANFGSNTTHINFDPDPNSDSLSFTYIGEEKTITTTDGKKYTITNTTTESSPTASNTLKYTYNPNLGQITLIGDKFTISASDGVEHNINLNGSNNVINGSDKNDNILISNGSNNKILGNDGNDTITSKTSNNKIFGGNGDDTITIDRDNGSYEINGGDGNDKITINANNTNNIKGGNGDDTILLNGSNNTADGNDGNDNIGANGNNNTINVSDSNNIIYTIGNNNKIIETGDNSNNISLQGNNNEATLNNGNNTINIVNSTGANVTVGDGNNNIKIIGQDNTVATGNGNNIVNITGNNNTANTGDGNDQITIAGDRNTANTGNGNDQVIVNSGNNNNLDGGSGDDILSNLGTDTQAINFEYLKKKTDPFSLQIGPNAYDLIEIDFGFMLGNNPIDVLSEDNARNSLDYVDSLLKEVNKQISEIGAYQNRLAGIADLNTITKINLSSFQSTIMDADIAKEMFYLTKDKIRNQACINLINVNEEVNKNLIIKLLGNL